MQVSLNHQVRQNHIVLIGFKHVGKTVIGKNLAKALKMAFIDLDQQIEGLYTIKFNKRLTCRQIVNNHGQDFFRKLEKEALKEVMVQKPAIISLGGGTLVDCENQNLVKSNFIIHITSPRGIVFERIQMSGRPGYFDPKENLIDSFNRLWDERIKIYENICHFSIANDGSIDDALCKIITKMNLDEGLL